MGEFKVSYTIPDVIPSGLDKQALAKIVEQNGKPVVEVNFDKPNNQGADPKSYVIKNYLQTSPSQSLPAQKEADVYIDLNKDSLKTFLESSFLSYDGTNKTLKHYDIIATDKDGYSSTAPFGIRYANLEPYRGLKVFAKAVADYSKTLIRLKRDVDGIGKALEDTIATDNQVGRFANIRDLGGFVFQGDNNDEFYDRLKQTIVSSYEKTNKPKRC